MDQPGNARDVPAPSDSAEALGAEPRNPPRRHDQTYKLLFAQPEAAQSLIRDVLARCWSDELDMETLERFPTEHVDAALRRSLSDMAWRVWFKGGARSVVFLVEFQSSSDENMAWRMWQYVAEALKYLKANPKVLDRDEFLPLVGPYEVYTGPGRSTAERSVRELFKLPAVPPKLRGEIAGFPSCDYVGVDVQRMHGAGLLARDTVAGWVGALEREPLASLPRVHASLAAHLGGSAHVGFRDALAKWTGERLRAVGMPSEVRDQIEERIVNPRERPEMAQTWQEWIDVKSAEAVAEALAKGEAKGLAKGLARSDARQRRLVVRLATRRFGAETGERLAELVESMGAGELACVGDLVVDCGTGDELLARASNGVSIGH